MNNDINKRMAIGAGWMIGLQWVSRVIGLFSVVILARLLLPEDYGLVAYALVFLGILQELSMFSFQTVLIRDQDAPKDRYNTVWTLEIIKGLVISAILIVGAKPAAVFFGEPQVEGILYWIAIIPTLRGFDNIGIVDFQKFLELHKNFYLNVFVQFGGTIATVVLAFVLRNYWALVIGRIITATLRLALTYVLSGYRPRLCLSETSRVLSFSMWLLAQNIFSSINMRLPVIVIGRYFEAAALGLFNMARELTNLATNELAAPIRHALYPGLAKMQDDQSQMARTATKAMGIIALVGLPVTVGIGLTAPLMIPVLLGDNWVDVAPIVSVLSIHAAIYMLYPNSHLIYYAIDRPKITAQISILRMCILVPIILWFVPEHGVFAAAWAIVATTGIVMIVDYLVLFRLTAVTFSHAISAVWRSILAVTIMAACVILALLYPIGPVISQSTPLHLAICVATGVVSYCASLSIIWWLIGTPEGPEAYLIRTLKKVYDRIVSVRLKNTQSS